LKKLWNECGVCKQVFGGAFVGMARSCALFPTKAPPNTCFEL